MARRLSVRRTAAASAGAGLVAVAGAGAGAWHLSTLIGRDAMRVRPLSRRTPIEVVAVGDAEITLRARERLGTSEFTSGGPWHDGDGWYGVGGHRSFGLVGPVLARAPDGAVTRRFARRAGAPVAPGERVRLGLEAFWPDPSALGLGVTRVHYPSRLGPMPAWLIPGAHEDSWAVVVHGRGADRTEGLRLARVLHAAGRTTLVIGYRNDPGAPSTDGLARFGQTETDDVEAALRFARAEGARRVVLAGISMGGGIVAQLLVRADTADLVERAVLDSPLLDPRDAIRAAAARVRLLPGVHGAPRPVVDGALAIAARRFGVTWRDVDAGRRAADLRTPILIVHREDDRIVPSGPSVRLAARRPDLVELHRPAGTGHTDAWNSDPAAYDALVTRALGGGGAAGPGAAV